jgi:methionyl-tRNA synthetase
MAREITFGKDGDFSWEQFINRYNSELANDLGNLLSRATSMMKQYFDGRVPEVAERGSSDGEMRRSLERARDAYFKAMDALEIHNGVAEVFAVVRDANRYIEEKAPWALVKKADGEKAAAAVLFDVCEVLRGVAVLLCPVMPSKSLEIWRALGIGGDIAGGNFESAMAWRDSWVGVSSQVGEIRSLFPRIDIGGEAAAPTAPKAGGTPEAKREEGKMTPDEGASPQPSGLLDLSEFKKLDLRVADVKSAAAVPGASKLLKLLIDIGGEERQIVAGIAEHYSPDELTGKSIVVITNLKPARIRGVDSNGMLLAATDGGKVIVLVPDKPAAAGSKIS